MTTYPKKRAYNSMNILKRIFRVSEWFGSKLPLQIAVFLILAYNVGYDAKTIATKFVLFIAYSVTYFSISYLANDLSDIEDDKKAGKRNAFRDTSINVGIVAFVITTLLHFASVVLISMTWQFLVFSAVGYLFGIFYSFKPFRFKERGVVGLVVASFFQRNLQLFVIPFMFVVDWVPFVLINVASFVYGIRFILIHQYMDYENDKVSGTKTFVGKAKKITKLIIYICVSIELAVIFVSFAMLLIEISYLYFIALIAGYALEILVWWLMRVNKQQDIFTSYFYVPMNFVYLFVLPVISCIVIAVADISVSYWAPLYIVTLILAFYKTIKFHVEYIASSIERAHIISCGKKNAKRIIYQGGIRFLNVIPKIENEDLVSELSGYTVVSPIKIQIDIKDLLPYFSKHECVELRYNIPDSLSNQIEREKVAFQTQNDDMRNCFSVYIFKKPDFDRFHRGTIAKTIIMAAANCNDLVAGNVELKSVVIENTRSLEKEYATFSGLACAELYHRKKECFMKVFPFSLFFTALFLVMGLVGYFVQNDIFIFSLIAFMLNACGSIIVSLIEIFNQGIRYSWALRYTNSLYGFKINKIAVPRYMVYGIYTNEIVKKANYQRIKATILLLSITIALSLTLLIW